MPAFICLAFYRANQLRNNTAGIKSQSTWLKNSLFKIEISLTYNTMLAPGVQHSDSIFLYIAKWPMWSNYFLPYTTFLQYYWLCSPCYIFPPGRWLIYFPAGSLYLHSWRNTSWLGLHQLSLSTAKFLSSKYSWLVKSK